MEELIDREFDIAWHGEDSRRSHPTQVIEILLECVLSASNAKKYSHVLKCFRSDDGVLSISEILIERHLAEKEELEKG